MLLGRDKEIRLLKKMIEDDKSHFVAVYGRRRVGKTFLIRETFDDRFAFSHAGVYGGRLKDQLFAFEKSIAEAGGMPAGAKNWQEAFEKLKDLIRTSTEKKKIIFIDELSWMDTQKSDMMMALEHFWNAWASARKDIVLIICASATSWMLSKVVHNKGGLYNRLTEQIHLGPFSLGECEEYTRYLGAAFNREQILQYYMIFGGIPYYWSFIKKGLSLAQNVDSVLFAEDAPLRDEFDYLFASIFKNPTVHLKLIKTLAKKKTGMTREELITGAHLTNSGDITVKLDELEKCGFIRKYQSYGMKKKNAIYQLIDNFTYFYYSFLENKPTDGHFWSVQMGSPRLNTWQGLAFERACLLHIDKIKEKLGISGVLTETFSWYTRPDPDRGISGSQIDLIIVRKDQVINICEIKYSESLYAITAAADRDLRKKISDFVTATGTKYAIHPTFITMYGLMDNSYAGNIQSVVTMEDLF